MIDKLIALDRAKKLRIAVVGDAMRDVYVHGRLESCQENCPKFVREKEITVDGGALNAKRSLENWNVTACSAFWDISKTKKTRFVVNGHAVFRDDDEQPLGILPPVQHYRDDAMKFLRETELAAVLISDYDKGFMDAKFIRGVIDLCKQRGIPCVADAKREPAIYEGAIIKGNEKWRESHGFYELGSITTHGSSGPGIMVQDSPQIHREHKAGTFRTSSNGITRQHDNSNKNSVPCVNHVGAGDCFAAHLVLALAHGFTLEQAAEIAHSAGRVYVQFPHNRPPFPHEIKRDLDPVLGKIVDAETMPALRQATIGKLVFTNGCFDLFGPQHLYCLREARKQGDFLCVGINSDASVSRLKGAGRPIVPQEQRAALIAALECVDAIVVYDQDTPVDLLKTLRPDVRVKGDCADLNHAGDEYCGKVHLVPLMEGWSTTTLIDKVRGSR